MPMSCTPKRGTVEKAATMTVVDWQEHPLAGIAPAIGEFVRTEVTQYDRWGHDLSVGYNWPRDSPDTKLTFYVYPSGNSSDSDQIRPAVQDVCKRQPATKVLGQSQVVVNGLNCIGVELLVPSSSNDRAVQSSVLVCKADDWFVKVRSTSGTAFPKRPCSALAENLFRRLGAPNTRRRLDSAIAGIVRLIATSSACWGHRKAVGQSSGAIPSRTGIRSLMPSR